MVFLITFATAKQAVKLAVQREQTCNSFIFVADKIA
jgi:hypothetical protein